MKDTRKKKTKTPDHRRIIFASTAHFLCGVGRQRNKNDSLDGSDRSRLSARM